MIQHVYERIVDAKRIDQVVVATDDRRIVEVVERFNGKALMTSEDLRSGSDRVAAAAEIMGLDSEDIIINVQGDQPLIHPLCLDAVVEPLLGRTGAAMTTLAYQIVDSQEYTSAKDCKVVMDQRGNALYFSRSPIPNVRDRGDRCAIYKHLGVYAYPRHFLEQFRRLPVGRLEQAEKLEQLRALEFGHPVRVVITPYDSPEVDLPEDIARIESRFF